MRHTRFHPIKLAWITAVVAGLMVGVATPADAEPGQWDPRCRHWSVRGRPEIRWR